MRDIADRLHPDADLQNGPDSLRLVRNVEPSYVDSGKFKEFWISFFNLDTIRKLRDLKTENIGNLVCFSRCV